jgi:hypothetical protein
MGAIGTMLLGMCAYAGGTSNSNNELLASNVFNNADDKAINEVSAMSSGFGEQF